MITIFTRKLFRIYPKLRSFAWKQYNKFYFKTLGIKYGRNLNVTNKIYVLGKGTVTIGDDFVFKSGDCCNPISRNIRGAIYTITPEACIEIGDRVGMSSVCLWAKKRITIGDNVNIGGDCLIMDDDAHPIDYMFRRSDFIKKVGKDVYFSKIGTAPVEIGDDVWIGAKCILLKGVHIGARSVIAAGSVVTKDIPADVIAGGNPCRIIRSLKAL